MIFFVGGCSPSPATTSASFTQQPSETPQETTATNLTPEPNYSQLFYGSWKITSFIPGGRFADQNEAEKYIGSTINFSEKEITINNTAVLGNPTYECVLVDTNERDYFWKYFFPDDPSEVLHLDSPYFAYIVVQNSLDAAENPNNDLLHYMNGFYIKDANTLVFDGSFGMLEMQRISYPPDYQNEIGGV